MKKTFHLTVACVVVLVVASEKTPAGLILQDNSNSARQIEAFEPVGQSFTAEDSSVLIAFSFFDVNTFVPNVDITMNLFSGFGIGGPQVGSVSQTLTPGLGSIGNGVFVDYDFTSVNLTVGNIYIQQFLMPRMCDGVSMITQLISTPVARVL